MRYLMHGITLNVGAGLQCCVQGNRQTSFNRNSKTKERNRALNEELEEMGREGVRGRDRHMVRYVEMDRGP